MEQYDKLKAAVDLLPIDDFITTNDCGECYVNWDNIDAADFKDHADDFINAMRKIKALQMSDGY
jgi:hypothetical protein